MQKVETVKRPLLLGETFLVPCFVSGANITPIVNHLHNDVENGQCMPHYHADYRFIEFGKPQYVKKGLYYYTIVDINRVDATKNIAYFELPVIRDVFAGLTPVDMIKNSKLKHKCIHKGKCPHRNFDLSQVQPVNGIITCPMHGLRFKEDTKQLLQTNEYGF